MSLIILLLLRILIRVIVKGTSNLPVTASLKELNRLNFKKALQTDFVFEHKAENKS